VLSSDLQSIRHLLRAAVDGAVRHGEQIVNTEAVIAALSGLFPYGIQVQETALREELGRMAKERGLRIQTGSLLASLPTATVAR
jgi:predicted ATP-dependent protease